jgi:hypothetical protein
MYLLVLRMKAAELLNVLHDWDRQGCWLFSFNDFGLLFPDEEPAVLTQSLARLTKAGYLIRLAKGLYANPSARSQSIYPMEEIALKLRPGELSYVSLESALSMYGWISQIPLGVLTVMTTGRTGQFKTPWGTIELTHTSRSHKSILENTHWDPNRKFMVATANAAYRDLKRAGRNLDLVTVPTIY